MIKSTNNKFQCLSVLLVGAATLGLLTDSAFAAPSASHSLGSPEAVPRLQTKAVFLTPTETQPSNASEVAFNAVPSPSTDRYDFGILEASGIPIQHLFLLRNNTKQTIVIQRVQPTCNCTTAFAGDDSAALPPQLAPGGWVPIHVSVDPSHFSTGFTLKSVDVFIAGQAVPAATLLVTGRIVAGVPALPSLPQSNALLAEPSSSLNAVVDSQSVLHLAVLDETSSEALPLGEAHYDFGHASAMSGKHIEHTFTLRNDSNALVRLDHLQPSCGCTSAVVGTDALSGTAAAPASAASISSISVAPHHIFKVYESIDPAHLSSGVVEKYLWVFVQGQSSAAAILRTTGTLDPGAMFRPSVLDFGRVVAGSSPTRHLVLTLDSRLISPGSTLKLAASDAEFLVTPVAAGGRQLASRNDKIENNSGTQSAAGSETREYQISISPRAHLGLIDSTLSLLIANPSGLVQATNVSLPLRGEVAGGISAKPQVIAFGMVTAGTSATQEIVVTGRSLGLLHELTATTNSPYITAKLVRSSTKKPEKNQVEEHSLAQKESNRSATDILRVSLSSKMPAGSLETQVNLTLPGGQRLVIPASVYIVLPEKH